MAVQTGIEPAISSVTERHVKPVHHWTKLVAEGGFEPTDLQIMRLTSYQAALLRDIMADAKGFEPLRTFRYLPVFKTGPFNQTWVSIRI